MKYKRPTWIIPLLTKYLTYDFGDFCELLTEFKYSVEDNPVGPTYNEFISKCEINLETIIDISHSDFSEARMQLNRLISDIKTHKRELRV